MRAASAFLWHLSTVHCALSRRWRPVLAVSPYNFQILCRRVTLEVSVKSKQLRAARVPTNALLSGLHKVEPVLLVSYKR